MGITGATAVVLMIVVIVGVLALNLGIFALIGLLFAYLWNTFVVPNVGADLPTLVWWQAALLLLALRVLMGIIMPSRS
jgi:hypothetical protein